MTIKLNGPIYLQDSFTLLAWNEELDTTFRVQLDSNTGVHMVEFEVDGQYEYSGENRVGRTRWLLSIFQDLKESNPGMVFGCTAYDGDDYEGYRQNLYRKVGFEAVWDTYQEEETNFFVYHNGGSLESLYWFEEVVSTFEEILDWEVHTKKEIPGCLLLSKGSSRLLLTCTSENVVLAGNINDEPVTFTGYKENWEDIIYDYILPHILDLEDWADSH